MELRCCSEFTPRQRCTSARKTWVDLDAFL